MNKIGILGGTFDPPHYGHLLIASEVLSSLKLDQIWFMPNHTPPHKLNGAHSASAHRVKMIEKAIEGNQSFKVQTIELEREGRSYTYDTMMLLKESYPDTSFYFIIGADMIEYLPKWHKINQLLNIVTFVGVLRPGYKSETNYPVFMVKVPQFDVSSTMIRERIINRMQTNYLLPDSVISYIKENKLYET
ncbi:nicotinate-nucleotide adenylyltransferase [Metabacillus arenae]|uniref:Probable nicotinate-nucleotide adenylyltransferase n=1 Tax=Metabacillus arenae TaxID=2771434 RepID=A0A926ND57_9BACI|nr:nicotinate-nucleotide adenylyltransferase [Metabacillus arenae]MBD1382072.1 nicotinate-nucleotide adenylyltransferase [Metabacillus arenae]